MGKTTLSISAAAHWANSGKNVLLIEMGDRGSIGSLLDTSSLTYEPRELAPRLWGMKITGRESLREYLISQIRIEKIYRWLFENRPVHYFFEVAPALSDLMILGKIVHELERKTRPGPFDQIVVDAPATGHALFLFGAPKVVRDLTRFGPIFDRAGKILSTLSSKKQTVFHIVSLPRSIVVGETVELIRELRSQDATLGRLFVNRLLLPDQDSTFQLPKAALKDRALSLLTHRARQEDRELRRLTKLSPVPICRMPEMNNLSLEFLADEFGKRWDHAAD